MKKLKNILLVDDSKGANSLNRRLLEEMNVCERVSSVLNGQEALEYIIQETEKKEGVIPELIFLDINMPVLDGYQFLEELDKLDEEITSNTSIIMLSTSIREIDQERSKNYAVVKGYQMKPLKKDNVTQTIQELTKIAKR